MRSGGRGWLWLALVAVLVVIALVGGRPPSPGTAFDPEGVGPSGGRALRETLESLGAEVQVTDQVGASTDAVLVLEDRLTDEQRDDLLAWVEDGGLLVIADPASPLTPLVVGDLGGGFGEEPGAVVPGRCTVDGLDDVGPVEPGLALRYEVGEDGSCYDSFVVEATPGRGRQRSVGGADVFTNDRLGDADNAVLAARLLDVGTTTEITWLVRDRSVPGEEGSLWALVSPGARAALLQAAIAALVYVVVRGRRLGPPLREPQPVQLAGSELVAAVGHLMQQRRDPDAAARLLRADLRRELSGRLGLPAGAPAELITQIVVTRFPVDGPRATRALVDHPVQSDEALVALARDIESIRQEVLHGHVPAQ